MQESIRFEVVSGKQRKKNRALNERLMSLVVADKYMWRSVIYDEKILNKILNGYHFLIARRGRKSIGYVVFATERGWMQGERVFVRSSESGRGLGTTMVRLLGKWARRKGFRSIYWVTNESMTRIAERMRKEATEKKGPFERVDIAWDPACSDVGMHLKPKKRRDRTKVKKPTRRVK